MKSVAKLLVICLCALPLVGAPHVWTGASNNRFSDPSNWVGGSPADDPAAELTFPAGAPLRPLNDLGGLRVRSISFAGSGFEVSGNPITLTNGSISSSGGPNKIAVDLNLDGDAVVTVARLPMTMNDPGLVLRASISGNGGLLKAGRGDLTYSGGFPNTYAGLTDIRGGTLRLAKPDGIAAISAPLSVTGAPAGTIVEAVNRDQIADSAKLSIRGSASLRLQAGEVTDDLSFIDDSGYALSDAPGFVVAGKLSLRGGEVYAEAANGDVEPLTVITAYPHAVKLAVDRLVVRGSHTPVVVSGSIRERVRIIDSAVTVASNAQAAVEMQSGSVSGDFGSLQATSGNLLTFTASGSISLGPDVTFNVRLDDYEELPGRVSGSIDLAGSRLALQSLLPSRPGLTRTLIRNDGTNPINGIFAGLPEGSLVNDRLRISYSGGDGNDVTLTDAGRTPTAMDITISEAHIIVGTPSTITARIHQAYPAASPTGVIVFHKYGGDEIGRAEVMNSEAQLTTVLPYRVSEVWAEYLGDAHNLPPYPAGCSVSVEAPPVTLTSIEPEVVTATEPVTITLRGSGFFYGTDVTKRAEGLPMSSEYDRSVQIVSPEEMKITFTPENLYNIDYRMVFRLFQVPTAAIGYVTVKHIEEKPGTTLRFDDKGVTAKVSPGTRTAWLGVAPGIEHPQRIYDIIDDTDHDGSVRFASEGGVDFQSGWVVADFAAGTFDGSGAYLNPLKRVDLPASFFVRDTAGQFTRMVYDEVGWLFLWARRGTGVWVYNGGGDQDGDGENGVGVVDVTKMIGANGSPPPPAEGFRPGDMLMAINGGIELWFGVLIDEALLSRYSAGEIRFTNLTDYAVNEQSRGLTIPVMRAFGADGTVSATYTTVDGTAHAGVDYVTTSGTMTFGPGELFKNIEVPVIDDDVFAPPRIFSIQLQEAESKKEIGTRTISIAEDDPFPRIVEVGRTTVYEGDSGTKNVDVRVTVGGKWREPVTIAVPWWRTPWLNSEGREVLTFEPGEYRKSITFPIDGDEVAEPNVEIYVGDLSQPAITVIDDDTPRFTLADVVVNEADGEALVFLDPVVVPVVPVTFTYATSDGSAEAGKDYKQRSGTCAWGRDSPLRIPIVGDTTAEKPEWFTVTITPPPGVLLDHTTATVTIVEGSPSPAKRRAVRK